MVTYPISADLSPSHPQLYCHLRTRSWVIPLYLSMPRWRVHTVYSIELSTACTEYCIYQVQHIPSTAYTENCYSRILHYPTITCPLLPNGLSSLSWPCCTQFSSLQVNQCIECQHPSHMSPDMPPPDSMHLEWQPSDWPPSDDTPPDQPPSDQSPLDRPPPSTPFILILHGLRMYLPINTVTASMGITAFTRSRPPSAFPNLFNHSLQMHLWVHLFAWSPSALLSWLNHGFQIHIRVHSISVSQCISKHGWQ